MGSFMRRQTQLWGIPEHNAFSRGKGQGVHFICSRGGCTADLCVNLTKIVFAKKCLDTLEVRKRVGARSRIQWNLAEIIYEVR